MPTIEGLDTVRHSTVYTIIVVQMDTGNGDDGDYFEDNDDWDDDKDDMNGNEDDNYVHDGWDDDEDDNYGRDDDEDDDSAEELMK